MNEVNELNDIRAQALEKINLAKSTAELESIEVAYLGRKGEVTALLRKISAIAPELRKQFGEGVNNLKNEIADAIESAKNELSANEMKLKAQAEAVDVTLPGRFYNIGHPHVLVETIEKVRQVFVNLGYEVYESPEIEHYKYNFEALNYPEEHPAMDEQMSFYVSDDRLLRTQTTAFQHRVMEKRKPPLKVCTIGKCYRYENIDATHGHTFHQVDCFAVGEGISMADLKGTLHEWASGVIGKDVGVRFRPDFFPFVEPGAEIAITCIVCDGKGCNVCKGSGWLELGGAGMMHPNVLRGVGIDPDVYSGFAFGLGIERMPMLTHAINDLRLFMDNDLRFLRQF